jgi:hypothetical protein
MTTPLAKHNNLANWSERWRKGETICSVECRRIDKSGSEQRGLPTLSRLADERGAPEAISMMIKPIAD